MKKFLFLFYFVPSFIYSFPYLTVSSPQIDKVECIITGGNYVSSIWNTGIFNQSLGSAISPSYEWPSASGKFLGISAGLCVGAYINNDLRIATASYNGEFVPGYIINGGGTPIPKTNDVFRIYKVSKDDNCLRNPDYCEWGSMIGRGAPYNDVNLNGIYDELIDIPGVKNAAQTIFVCLTDGFQSSHSIAEGFSGGTQPLYIEVAFTSWNYDYPGFEDVQFFNYRFKNMSLQEWNKTYFSMFFHPQIGDSLDDYVGCDTLRRLGYAYNRDNSDGTGSGNSYGVAPPAVGMKLLGDNMNLGMTSFHYTVPLQLEPSPPCEEFPNTPLEAYNLMRGYKKDNTAWLDISSGSPRPTKYVFSGDPETNSGWTEYNGTIGNCFGALSGEITPNFSVARTFLMSSGSDNMIVNTATFPVLTYAQMSARGSNNKNSVTKLKQLADKVQQFYNHNYTIGITPISSYVPDNFKLYQNYPNPFNPETKIKFDVPINEFVNFSVYDITGKLVTNFVNENLSAGTYEVNFSAANLPSGVYFYKLSSSSSNEIRKMILTK